MAVDAAASADDVDQTLAFLRLSCRFYHHARDAATARPPRDRGSDGAPAAPSLRLRDVPEVQACKIWTELRRVSLPRVPAGGSKDGAAPTPGPLVWRCERPHCHAGIGSRRPTPCCQKPALLFCVARGLFCLTRQVDASRLCVCGARYAGHAGLHHARVRRCSACPSRQQQGCAARQGRHGRRGGSGVSGRIGATTSSCSLSGLPSRTRVVADYGSSCSSRTSQSRPVRP